LLAGVVLGGILVVGIAGWARGTELAGAVIAQGFVVVESDVKKVQHPEGGVVGELNVRDGDHVEAGDVVVRLDATQTKANLGVVTKIVPGMPVEVFVRTEDRTVLSYLLKPLSDQMMRAFSDS
jgi:HlyD family secretion protein